MESNSLLLELLISGFFAIACFRTRAISVGSNAMSPRNLLRLTSRLERLRKTRWQWCAMVLVLMLVRLQSGLPLVVELTAALQFGIFLALPEQKQSQAAVKEKSARNRIKTGMQQMGDAKAG
jgi:hypothetical protein